MSCKAANPPYTLELAPLMSCKAANPLKFGLILGVRASNADLRSKKALRTAIKSGRKAFLPSQAYYAINSCTQTPL
jgi:hypothetical protein